MTPSPRPSDSSGDTGDLRSHQQRTVEAAAADFLGRRPGDQIKTMADYQREVGVGSGTVQKAIGFLESVGAVQLSRHGHLGTKVQALDRSRLWQFTGRGQVRLISTLPGAIDAFGLIKGLEKQFAKLGVPIGLQYLRGADGRADQVRAGHADIAIMSHGAADRLSARSREQMARVEFARGSYYAEGSLVRLERREVPEGRLRVAIDPRSFDHQRLTEAEFPGEDGRYELVERPYSDLPHALLEGDVDAGIWHRTLLPAPVLSLGLIERPLESESALELLRDISSAVLLVRSDDAALQRLLEDVDRRAVRRVQTSLLSMDPASSLIHDAVWSR